MEINYLGHASFLIKGKGATVICDPFDPKLLSPAPKVPAADIVTVSHDHADHNYTAEIKKNNPGVFIVSGPGEYEVKGVNISGIATFHDDKKGEERGKNIVFRFTVDDINLCHLGDLGHKLTEAQVEALDGVDVLFLPVGGFYTIDAKVAAEVMAQLSPSIIIPMHYKTAKHLDKVFEPLAEVSAFLKEIGREDLQPVPKLQLSRDKLTEESQVVLLG